MNDRIATRDELDEKVNQVFAGKVVRKDLVRKVKVGANIHEALDVPFGDHVIRVTVSIGVASYPEGSAKTAEMFLREAERALCAAQEAGRNGVVLFREGMTLSS